MRDAIPIAIPTAYAPYTPTSSAPWNRARAIHLLRRTGHRLEPDLVQTVLDAGPSDGVDMLVDQAASAPLPPAPAWRDEYPFSFPPEERDEAIRRERLYLRRYKADWMKEMYSGGLRERIAFFWHNHFVTEATVYHRAAWAYRYVDCLRRNALGDFKTFVREIGLTPAMLFYLNGNQNIKDRPNENYARELLELFTTGLDNYTEQDIKDIARALTGWRTPGLESAFFENQHDYGLKSIFGRTGSFDYDDVVEILFRERGDEIARFISAKMYALLIHVDVDEEVVGHAAKAFSDSAFDIATLVRFLIKSNAFFDASVVGGAIKSPVDYFLALVHDLGIDPQTWSLRGFDIFWFGEMLVKELGQAVLDPPDVSGWPGYHDWISSSSLTDRWKLVFDYSRYADPERALSTVSNPENPYAVARELGESRLGLAPDDDRVAELTAILLDGVPDYEWDPDSPGGRARVTQYIQYLAQSPEYQLM